VSEILVTGGAGFIGSHVADALLAGGHDVVVLDDLSGGFEHNVPNGATFVRASVTDAAAVDALFGRHSFDYVYHLAAYAAEGLSHFIKRFNYTNNLIGSVNLINAAVNTNVRGFVFSSSIAVYGASPASPMTEETPAEPDDSYGIAKLAVEQELKASRAMFGLDYIIFRPHNVYGPRQNIADRYRNVIGIFMNQALQGRSMTIFGDGSQTRAFSYIDDVAPVIAGCIDVPGAWNQVFNIGADTPYSLGALSREVAQVMGTEPDVQYLPARLEAVHAHSSHEKIRRTFGNRPETRLQDGLREMAAWVRSHGPRETSRFGAIEIARNLPAVWRSE
jgi:UDP-glucose 4-epimerase